MQRIVDSVLRFGSRHTLLPSLVRAYEGARERRRPILRHPLPSVGVGILTYNRPSFFGRVVAAAIDQLGEIADIYVYNDGSSPNDDYQRIFSRLPTALTIIDAPANRGVAHGKNQLLRAMESHDYLFLLEDDLIITSPTAVTGYIKASMRTGLEHLNFAHHGTANARGPLWVSAWAEFYPNCVGAWSMYTRRAVATVGLMDEHFHNAWEHVEHTHRLAKAGLTSPFWFFADAFSSQSWLREIPEGLHTSTIRSNPDWRQRMREGLEYWERKDPLHFPLAAMLYELRRSEGG